MQDVINFKIYFLSSCRAMVDREREREREKERETERDREREAEIQKCEYLEKEKSFWNKIKKHFS